MIPEKKKTHKVSPSQIEHDRYAELMRQKSEFLATEATGICRTGYQRRKKLHREGALEIHIGMPLSLLPHVRLHMFRERL